MKNLFKPDDSFIVRHEILRLLFDSAEKEKDPQRPQNRISTNEISEKLNVNFAKIDLYHELLHEEEEIHCKYNDDNSKNHFMLITSTGRQSYIYQKHLKEGKKERKEDIKDWISIFVPLLSLIISILAVVIALS
jgi:hypothetical protein